MIVDVVLMKYSSNLLSPLPMIEDRVTAGRFTPPGRVIVIVVSGLNRTSRSLLAKSSFQ